MSQRKAPGNRKPIPRSDLLVLAMRKAYEDVHGRSGAPEDNAHHTSVDKSEDADTGVDGATHPRTDTSKTG